MEIIASRLPLSTPSGVTDEHDIAILRQIAAAVTTVARQIDPATCVPPPYVARHASEAGHVRRIVLYHRPDALLHRACAFVGFLGKKGAGLPAGLVRDIAAADEHLMDSMVGHADLLGYASLELADRNWGNLVLFRHPEAVALVHQQEIHHHAARELAPHYYEWIHLYHGMLPHGIAHHDENLTVTKRQQFTFPTRTPSVAV